MTSKNEIKYPIFKPSKLLQQHCAMPSDFIHSNFNFIKFNIWQSQYHTIAVRSVAEHSS